MENLYDGSAKIMDAAEAALRQAGAMAVGFSFSILGAIILLIAGFIVASTLERWTYNALGRLRAFDETLRRFFSKIARYGVLLIVGVSVLAQFGVQTASIIAALGAIGLAIGLALQGTLQNIAAGIMLLVLRPFKAGEYVKVGELMGTIQEVGLFATELRTYDGLFVLAPNNELWNSPVTNYTRNPARLQDIPIGISYRDDIDLAQQVLAGLAAADSRVLDDPEPYIFIAELGDSSVVMTLRYWTKTADWWLTKNDLTKAAKQAFDEKGISIPFPQRDIHLFPAETELYEQKR
jgi:small conductance mechanosensitive channel